MSELKPCPFCGGEAITTAFFDADDFDYMPIEVNDCDAEVTCKNERCINGWWLSPKDWNTRPIEDELRARIAEMEEALEHVIEVGNYGWDVIRKYGWEEKEINWWNTASDKAYKCLRKGK